MSNWVLWLIAGIVMIVGGLFALFNPVAATVTVEQIVAWIFLFGGVLQIVGVFQASGWAARIWALVLALILIWLGISLLANPLEGILSLTLVIAVALLVSGVAKVFLSFPARGTGYFWPMLLSGAVSIVLAVMVFSDFPQSAAILLGVLLAVELLADGTAAVVYALMQRARQPV